MADSRPLTLETPFGPEKFLVQRCTGREGLSTPFCFEVDVLSDDPAIPFDELLGQSVTLALTRADGGKRYVNGIVNRLTQGGRDPRWVAYQVTIVPRLWLLTLQSGSRIFQDTTVPDILRRVFEELGVVDYRFALTGETPRLEYCVQYQESAFAFVSRLMEEHGLFYFFEHERGRHTLVIANNASVHQPCPGQPQVPYARVVGDWKQEAVITGLHMTKTLQSGAYAATDYDWTSPRTDLAVHTQSRLPCAMPEVYEQYSYPGGYRDKARGESTVQRRREAAEAMHHTIRGESTCRAFLPGYRFELVDHYRGDANTAYLLTEVEHEASLMTAAHSASPGGAVTYTNRFTCIPLSVPYRPPRRTPRPRITGPQTAFVVGPAGEEMYVDNYGRVKVQFVWDRQGRWNERSSCWLRVAQGWAGKHWGALFLPRIGQEVLIDFLHGDPNAPIITGRVYNAETMPPVTLPRDQEWSGVVSNRSGGEGCHALLMHDHRTEGKVVLQSYGDMHTRTQRNTRVWTGHDYDEIVKGTYTKEVGQNTYMRIGHAIVIDAGTTLTIKAAGGFIKIDPSGITIQGTLVQINSGGVPGSIPGSPHEATAVQPGQSDTVPRRFSGRP